LDGLGSSEQSTRTKMSKDDKSTIMKRGKMMMVSCGEWRVGCWGGEDSPSYDVCSAICSDESVSQN
jgi:hypothetical protein